MTDPTPGPGPAADRGFSLLHLDEWLAAVDKPPGLHVHRSELAPREPALLPLLRDRLGRHVWPVHRLDRATSGIVLFALDRETLAGAAAQFRQASVEKRYLAVVRGVAPESGRVDHPIRDAETAETQSAETEFRRLAWASLADPPEGIREGRWSLVEARPRTGRRHQLRRHLRHLAHPILGDTTYGDGRHNRLLRERFGIHRLMLAATGLGLTHPRTGQPLWLTAAPPPEFLELARHLGWACPPPTG